MSNFSGRFVYFGLGDARDEKLLSASGHNLGARRAYRNPAVLDWCIFGSGDIDLRQFGNTIRRGCYLRDSHGWRFRLGYGARLVLVLRRQKEKGDASKYECGGSNTTSTLRLHVPDEQHQTFKHRDSKQNSGNSVHLGASWVNVGRSQGANLRAAFCRNSRILCVHNRSSKHWRPSPGQYLKIIVQWPLTPDCDLRIIRACLNAQAKHRRIRNSSLGVYWMQSRRTLSSQPKIRQRLRWGGWAA